MLCNAYFESIFLMLKYEKELFVFLYLINILEITNSKSMCFNFAMVATKDELDKHLKSKAMIKANFKKFGKYTSVFPTDRILTMKQNGEISIDEMKWGLIPNWASDIKIGKKMFNARSETLEEKPSFKSLLNKKRCVIFSTSFFELKRLENKKNEKYSIGTGKIETFAGLWDKWLNKETGEIINSTTIITTEPNEKIAEIHNRMPVFINNEDILKWIDSTIDFREVKHLLRTKSSDDFIIEKVENERS